MGMDFAAFIAIPAGSTSQRPKGRKLEAAFRPAGDSEPGWHWERREAVALLPRFREGADMSQRDLTEETLL